MDDDEWCEATGPGGLHCTLPKGHGDGEQEPVLHAFAIQLTPDIGTMIDEHVTQLEEARERYERLARWERRARWLLIAALIVNIIGGIINWAQVAS